MMRLFRLFPEVRSKLTMEIHPETIRRFYNAYPFPEFDPAGISSFSDLRESASSFIRKLDQVIPSTATILDAGCGSGQHSVYLGHVVGRRVIGFDFSDSSLERAESLRKRLAYHNVSFIKADLFALPDSIPEADFVFCNGVLHHTQDPRRGFALLVEKLKAGGHIAVGLYHVLGRRKLWKNAKRMQKKQEYAVNLDAYYRTDVDGVNEGIKKNWILNMFFHPGESGHSYLQTAGWFEEENLQIQGTIPDHRWKIQTIPISRTTRNRPSLPVIMQNLKWLALDLRMWIQPFENGFFVMFGQKPEVR